MPETSGPPSFFARVAMAFIFCFRILFKPAFAAQMLPYRRLPERLPSGEQVAAPAPAPPPPEKQHAPALFVLGLLQREGRLIDFLQEDVAGFSDQEVGAAARVVHEGCRRALGQYLELAPVLTQGEGAAVDVPLGFDASRIRLTGNVAGQPPYKGALRHHGWVATAIRLPVPSDALDPKVIAPAEVELA